MYLNIITILISLGALVFSIISFRKSQKIKRIENYLQFGTPQEIDEELKYLEEKKSGELAEVNRQYEKRKKEINEKFIPIPYSEAKKKVLQEANDQNERKIEKIESEFNHKANILELKKNNLANL